MVGGDDGAWGIQVGAFVKFAQAKNAADNAAERIPRLASAAAIDVQAVDAKGRTLYRARLIGMSLDIARRSCGKLQDLGLDCALVTPTGSIRMAALAGT